MKAPLALVTGLGLLFVGDPYAIAQQTKTSTSIPSRTDALAAGDRIQLLQDSPIFEPASYPKLTPDTSKPTCLPAKSKLIIIDPGTVQATTTAEPAAGGATPTTQVSQKNNQTLIQTTGASKTTTTAQPVATATLLRVGKFQFHGTTAQGGCAGDSYKNLPGGEEGQSYTFAPADLADINYSRIGWTYGAVVVPYKFIVADRSFSSSASLLPYVGRENWLPGFNGATVLAAGIGTAPSSAQTSTPTPTTPTPSTTTKATLSLAIGEIYTISGAFKIGILVGVDTQGSGTGFKYQGKPWLALSLGAGN